MSASGLQRLVLLAVILGWTAAGRVGAQQPGASAAVDRLASAQRVLEEHVQREQIAGAVGLVLHRGDLVYSAALGMRDRETEEAMTADTIFRIASMTKPITSVAVMMLRDEGELELDDPLAKYLPEFQTPEVFQSREQAEPHTVAAQREITIRDLLTHTSGISYRFLAPEPLGERFVDADVSDGLVETPWSLAENTRRLAGVPLASQPGEAWQYGLSTDVLGRLVEVVSGETLDGFFEKRIFQPLQMHDTHFTLPQEKRDRLATLYRPADDGTIEPVGPGPQRVGTLVYSATFPHNSNHQYHSGGAGLVSTAADYAKFLTMLLEGGQRNGVRLLQADSVAEMTRNQIGELSIPFAVHGDQFGYGFGVHSKESGARHGASVGTYSWGGIFNTYFWVDPEEEVIGILMTQLHPFGHLSLWSDYQAAVHADLGDG